MKNKKLFAILTLVCFMFTLMPVAAFAAPTVAWNDPAVNASYVKVAAEGGFEDEVYVTAAPLGVTVTASVYCTTGSAWFTSGSAYYAVSVADGKETPVQIKYTTTEAVQFTFGTVGTYKIYAVKDSSDSVTPSAYGDSELEVLVSKANSMLESVSVADAVNTISLQMPRDIVRTAAVVVVEPQDANFAITVNGLTGSAITRVNVVADNGFSAAGNDTITVKLTNNGTPVVGKAPTITAPDYVTVTPANPKKVVTSPAGEIVYNISANKAGDFKVVFSYEDAIPQFVPVRATNNNVANVEVVTEAANPINNDATLAGVYTGAVVKFTDASGKAIIATGIPSLTGSAYYVYSDQIKVTVVSQPTGSRLNGSDFELKRSTVYPGAVELYTTTQGMLKVGSYKVNFALANGNGVTVDFEAAKMTDAVGIRFVKPMETIALGTTASAADFKVQAYDAKGVVKYLNENNLYDGYSLSAQGKALVANGDVFTVSTDEKYIGSTVTVLAATNDDRFVITTAVEVVDNGAEVVYANTTAEVGVTTILKASVFDVKGNKVGNPTATPQFIVLEKPENAYVNVVADTVVAGDKDFTVSFLGSVAGEYKVQTIFVDGNNEFVTGITTITVGNNEVAFKDVIVMSIGANKLVKNSDVVEMLCAPVVKDGRTFVPFRAGLEALGATVNYDPATGAITAELNNIKVVMMNGEKAYTVNGVEKVADVAPYLNVEASTTMVPVRFAAEAFGITVTPIYDANGVCDVLFAN